MMKLEEYNAKISDKTEIFLGKWSSIYNDLRGNNSDNL